MRLMRPQRLDNTANLLELIDRDQIGLDEDAYAALEKLTEGSGETISSMGRRLLTEAIQKGSKRK